MTPKAPPPALLLGHFHCKVRRRQQHPSTQLRSQPAGPFRPLDWVTALKCSNSASEMETGGVFIVATRRQSGNTESGVQVHQFRIYSVLFNRAFFSSEFSMKITACGDEILFFLFLYHTKVHQTDCERQQVQLYDGQT